MAMDVAKETDATPPRRGWFRRNWKRVLGGLLLLFRYVKQRSTLITDSPLSAEERRQAEALLASQSGKETT